MAEERLEVLRMVSEKKISVEEAERLLAAMDEGSRKGEEARPASSGRGGSRIGEILQDVGSMVQGLVEDAVSGIGSSFDKEASGDEEVVSEAGSFALPAGTRLCLRSRHWRSGGDLHLVAGEGDSCTVTGSAARVFRKKNRTAVLLGEGTATVTVPPTVAELSAVRMGGAIRAEGLGCPVELKSMGGGVSLRRVRAPFEVKTMGGDLELDLEPGLAGDSRGASMGGDIRVELPGELRASIRAVTMGGAIDVDPQLGAAARDRGNGLNKVSLETGPAGEPRLALSLKTSGGSVFLHRKS